MKSLDPKSLLAGLLLGLAAVLLAGQASPVPSETGRFQAVASHDGQTVYVIDTATGRLLRLDALRQAAPADFETMARVRR